MIPAAWAIDGYANPWQIGLQPSNSPSMVGIHSLHNYLVMPIITVISLFVLGLLVYVMVRFNEKAHPVPSKLTHHTGLEIAWTLIPALILVFVAIPSFRLLRFEVELPKPDITVKAIGHQWYWSYEYAADQNGGFAFDSYMLSREEAVKEIGRASCRERV
mgnify:CR=1 FL=1